MTSRDLLNKLHDGPFQPFRVKLSNNTTLDVLDPNTVVVGPTPQLDGDVLDLGYLQCIDTNCWQGGWLTALDVESGQVWKANQRGDVLQERLRNRPRQ